MSQTFAELGLNPELTAGLEALGYEQPTKLQSDVIPQLLAGRDVVAEAPPAVAKPLPSFYLFFRRLIPKSKVCRSLLLPVVAMTPRRTANLFQELSHRSDIQIVPVRGGQPITREVERLTDTTTIVVGTCSAVK